MRIYCIYCPKVDYDDFVCWMKKGKRATSKANCSIKGISPRGNGENIMLLAVLTDY